jgi:PKD repeat protein
VRFRDKYIRVAHPDEPLADFRAVPREGPAPLTVDFEDFSSGTITDCTWDFGDLQGGAERHPDHLYRAPGYYTVTLRVRGPHGEDVAEKRHYIHVKGFGGGGASSQKSRSKAGDEPGGGLDKPTPRPKKTKVLPEVVTPHALGGEVIEKTKTIYAQPPGGGGPAGDQVYDSRLHDQYQRAAEDSIQRERIPPGARDTVRRYFEGIRPR